MEILANTCLDLSTTNGRSFETSTIRPEACRNLNVVLPGIWVNPARARLQTLTNYMADVINAVKA
jgi:hypothetical protein